MLRRPVPMAIRIATARPAPPPPPGELTRPRATAPRGRTTPPLHRCRCRPQASCRLALPTPPGTVLRRSRRQRHRPTALDDRVGPPPEPLDGGFQLGPARHHGGGGEGRRAEAMVGDLVTQRPVALVADGGDDRRAAVAPGPTQVLLAERQQLRR